MLCRKENVFILSALELIFYVSRGSSGVKNNEFILPNISDHETMNNE
jgi:hypothetical protein